MSCTTAISSTAGATSPKSADIASAVKPIISTLLPFALQEGKLESVDDKVSDFEPSLKSLNDGKECVVQILIGATWKMPYARSEGLRLTSVLLA